MSDVLNIETNFTVTSNYSIKNISGQELQAGQATSSINVTNLQEGLYFIEIINKNKTYKKKFLKL